MTLLQVIEGEEGGGERVLWMDEQVSGGGR